MAVEASLAAADAVSLDLRTTLARVLADVARSGAPDTYRAAQIVQSINLACTPPLRLAAPRDLYPEKTLPSRPAQRATAPTQKGGRSAWSG